MKPLHKFFAVICALVFISCTGTVIAECDSQNEFIACKKTYINESQVHFVEKALFVEFNNMLIETTAIHVDQGGFYFKDYRKGRCNDGEWECSECDSCNPLWFFLCPNCGKANWQNG